MANKRGGRRRRRYLRGKINVEEAVGAIGTKAVNLQIFPDVVFEKTWISSISAAWTLSNLTPLGDAGPLLIGIAHSDYSAAEVEEYLENVDSWNEGNKVQQEIAKRLIRVIGIFETPDDAPDSVTLNDGVKIHTKCGWSLATGQTLNLFIYNFGGNSISATSSPNIAGRGHANLWPQ